MPLNTAENTGNSGGYDLPDITDGTYFGRIVSVVDVGIQKQTDWKTKEEKPAKEEVFITVEFPKLRLEIEDKDTGETTSKPRWLGKNFKVVGPEQRGYDNSNMKKVLAPLMDDGVDLRTLINKQVICEISHTNTGKPKIKSLAKAPEEVNVPELENDQLIFDFYDPDPDVYVKLPTWIKKVIKEAVDFEGSQIQILIETHGLDEDD